MKTKRSQCLFSLFAVILAFGLFHGCLGPPTPTIAPPAPTLIATPSGTPDPTNTPAPPRSLIILVDDFLPQSYQGAPVYYYNRLGGDRGAINDSILHWGVGQVTTTISLRNSWGGVWMSLNHPIREGLALDLSAILPSQISPRYQSQITGITVRVVRGTPGKILKLELKDSNELRWMKELTLEGGQQVVNSELPALSNVNHLVWVLDRASAGDYVVLDSITFTATTQITDTSTAAFVWSYGMLLNNWNPTTGLVRDKARDASGEFDAIQATGSLAAATAVAEQLGIIERADAIQIVTRISETLLLDLPRHNGLWPHWVKVSPGGEITIVENTEWSSVDTVIAAIGLLVAQSGLSLDTSGTEQMLQAIDWDRLVTPGGISHGYSNAGDLLPYAWDTFGGESWLVNLAYAGGTGHVAPMAYPSPPTANGSGFIDELAWLFVPPPSGHDYWGTDWTEYRAKTASTQLLYYPSHYPESCFTQLGLFGLSAAEVPDPSLVPQADIYQAFSVGGRFGSANDGSALLGVPVVIPHYAALIASLRPKEAIEMWDWLINHGHFSPLSNIEGLMFPVSSGCEPGTLAWNQLKGSWNLSLQTLGWGRYLAERAGIVPILWQATPANSILRRGYEVLVHRGATLTATPNLTVTGVTWPAPTAESPVPIAAYVPQLHETPTTPIWESAPGPCSEKPLYEWRAPGTYIYRITDGSGAEYLVVEQQAGTRARASYPFSCDYPEVDITSLASNFGESFAEPPKAGSSTGMPACRPPQAVIAGYGTMSTVVVGTETKRTQLGTFEAVRVDTNLEYSVTTGLHDTYEKTAQKSEWYACGYGLVHSAASLTEMKNWRKLGQSSSQVTLISYTPSSTNESHVRYILVDLSLSNNFESYRSRIADEETAEALRRWDAGIRVVNVGDFEHEMVDGHWRIVYSRTGGPIDGMSVILTSDAQQ